MSSNAADASADAREGYSEVDEIKSALATSREELVRKIERGRVRDAENEKVRNSQHRALAYVCSIELKTIEAERLEELTEKVERLEEVNEIA